MVQAKNDPAAQAAKMAIALAAKKKEEARRNADEAKTARSSRKSGGPTEAQKTSSGLY